MVIKFDKTDPIGENGKRSATLIMQQGGECRVVMNYITATRLAWGSGEYNKSMLLVVGIRYTWRRVFWRFYWRMD